MLLEGCSHFLGIRRLAIFGLHDDANGQAVLAAELEVALIVRGNGPDGAGAVFHQDEVPYPDRKLLLIERIGGMAAGEKAFLLGGGRVLGFYRTLTHASELAFRVFFPR